MQTIREAIYVVCERYRPVTVRQVYYRLVSGGVIDKTEAEYKTVVRLMTDMRRKNELPFHWVADSTRWMRKPTTHSSLAAMLERSQRFYRRDIWESQDVYVEVWLEKEALAGVLFDVTCEWDVPLMVCRGYPSLSFLHSAAETIGDQWKPVYLYYFGDYDPSGVDIYRSVIDGISELTDTRGLTFERVAVTPEQIEDWDLPTRPTKKTDTRSKGFVGQSVEVDAIDPEQLKAICRSCITQHIDEDELQRTQTAEEAERETLSNIIANLGGAA